MENMQRGDLQAVVVRYTPFLSEIRKRLLFIFSVFFIAWGVGFIYYQPIVMRIMGLYNLQGVNITFTSPFQFLNLALNSGMIIGIIIVFPLVIYQLLSFLKPALRPAEFLLVLRLLPLNLILFVAGFLFGTWVMKFIVSIYSQQTNLLQIDNLWDVNQFLMQFFVTATLLGILFQFPIILTLLLRLGVVKHASVKKQRIPVYAVLLLFVILLPPTDIFSMLLMFFPLVIIFEIALLLNKGKGESVKGKEVRK